jgi:threonine synthase
MVYYFFAVSKLKVGPCFVVPTGNFGDIYAGYAAMKCGLPISKLVVASNSNDSLTRFFATGEMAPRIMQNTLSPSMDIQVSSNFERLLFDMCDQDAAQLRALMADLKNKNIFRVSATRLMKAKEIFIAGCADDAETLAAIANVYKETGTVLDPHTAVGVKVAQDFMQQLKQPVVCLATAHAAKFPGTVQRAAGVAPSLPAILVDLMKKSERRVTIEADVAKITNFIKEQKRL